MVKKQLLILLIVFGCGNSSQAMIEQWLGVGICDFGVLKNPSQDDRDAYQKYRQSQAPIVLAMNAYNIANRVKSLASTIDVYSNALGYKGVEFNGSLVELEKYILKEYTYFLGYLREVAVDCSARGSIHVPKHAEFNSLMAKVLARVIHGHCDKRKQLESDVQKAKAEEDKWYKHYLSESTRHSTLKSASDTLKAEHQKLTAALDLATKDINRKDRALIDAAYAISDLEDANKDLKEKVTHQEKVALEVAKATVELEERNEDLQEQRDRSRHEKVALIERFKKDIKDASDRANQGRVDIVSLRKEISPLRRQISPLRRHVAEKDAEIARLRQALAEAQSKH